MSNLSICADIPTFLSFDNLALSCSVRAGSGLSDEVGVAFALVRKLVAKDLLLGDGV